jgi:hypothetical protein
MRAVKRERYGKKELEQLKTVLGLKGVNTNEVEMEDLNKIATGKKQNKNNPLHEQCYV